MERNRNHPPNRSFRRIVLPVGVAVTLLVAGCSSTSTPVASSAPSTAGSATSTPAPSAPVSAPVSAITEPSVAISAQQSATGSAAPESSGTDSSGGEASAPPESSQPDSSALDSSGPDSGTGSSATPNSELPVATVNTTDADALKALAAMNAALLTAAQIGTGFTKSPDAAPDAAQKLPCGGYSASALYPNALHTELIAARGQDVQFQESLYLYLDTETSTKAFQTELAGLDCTKGTISGTPVTIGRSQDVTASVGGTKAVAWEVTIDGATGVLVAVNSGSVFIGYTFLVATGTDPTTLPNPLALAKKATAKVLAGGLG